MSTEIRRSALRASPGMMVWGAIFHANARGDEAAVDARIRDLLAFIGSIQEK